MRVKLGRVEITTGSDMSKAKMLSNYGYPAISGVSSPAYRSLQRLKNFFDQGFNTKYDLYDAIVDLDPDLQGALNTVAIIVAKAMKGFTVQVGSSEDEKEAELKKELTMLHKKLTQYYYDIAYKLFKHGDVPYFMGVAKGIGLMYLKWIPINYMTMLDDKDQFTRFDYAICIQAPQWYVLNEIPTVYGQTQWIPAKDVIHFNWTRQEESRDRWNRRTLGIMTLPPLESLVPKIIWKFNLQINDVLVRDLMVPREVHELPGEMFNPELFDGNTQEEKIQKALAAGQAACNTYSAMIEQRRPDRAYVILNSVKISVLEPKMKYTEPNDQIKQLNESVNASIGTPNTVVSGQTSAGSASFGGEIAIGNYFMTKAEFIAGLLGEKMISLAKRHLTVKFGGKFADYYDKIGFRTQIILYPEQAARMVATLRPLKLYTRNQLRAMVGDEPLTKEEEKEIDEEGQNNSVEPPPNIDTTHTQTPTEAAAHTGSVQKQPDSATTPHSKELRQKT